MEAFELILVLLACTIFASVVDSVVRRVSLPLIQIAVGFVVALFLPAAAEATVDPELFLALFIAPLLFSEAHESNKRDLLHNLPSILSLAIGLVLATVLVVGFTLNWMVPSIPLAAAFACAAALGPTDAAAVGALGSTVSLSKRQKTLLSGEALINDASGVVSFQFAIAAAVTGAFSAAQAGSSFAVLFFGGIAAGVVMGAAAFLCIDWLGRRGLVGDVVFVLYEVLTPFVVFLLAEELHVSGILAVVAAGLIMAQRMPRLVSTALARRKMISSGFWEIIIYLINGVIFVLLGMQLPRAMSPTLSDGLGFGHLLAIVVVVTLLVMGMRLLWVWVMEIAHRSKDRARSAATARVGSAHVRASFKDALVTTIAGPKGAVTLSIIFTIPYFMSDGSEFPERDLIIFITAGVILLTLLVADLTLARLAPAEKHGATKEEVGRASIRVIQATIEELESKIASGTKPEYEPATRVMVSRYRSRLLRERLAIGKSRDAMAKLVEEVLDVQQARAEKLQQEIERTLTKQEAAPYYNALRALRRSLGYYGKSVNVGTSSSSFKGRAMVLWHRLFPKQMENAEADRIYYQTCLFAIDMERAAVGYLNRVIRQSEGTRRGHVARALCNEHKATLRSLCQRIGLKRDAQGNLQVSCMGAKSVLSDETIVLNKEEMPSLTEQYRQVREYSDEVEAGALSIELDKVRELQDSGEISDEVAFALRENVYLLQMSLAEE